MPLVSTDLETHFAKVLCLLFQSTMPGQRPGQHVANLAFATFPMWFLIWRCSDLFLKI